MGLIRLPKYFEPSIDKSEMIGDRLQSISLLIKFGQPMPWTVDDSQQLRQTQDEVEQLRDEK